MKSISYQKPRLKEIDLLNEAGRGGESEPPPPSARRDGVENPLWKAERRFSKFPWEEGDWD